MMKYDGFATMFMRMPMSTSTLPVQGSCTVEERRITLKFPFTGIEFELPGNPQDCRTEFDFKIRGVRGDMTMTIGYISELKAYTGVGKQEDDDMPVLTFCFFPIDSPLTRLPKL